MNNIAQFFNTNKFKTALITIAIRTKPEYNEVSKNALLAKIFSVSCDKYRTKRDITEKLENMKGAVFDVSVIKKGDEHIILFYMETLCIEQSNLFEEFEFLREIIYKPFVNENKFDIYVFDREKNRLLNEIKSKRDNMNEYAIDRCVEEMYGHEGFGLDCTGYLRSTEKITSSELFDYYKYIIKNCPFEIIVSGNVNEEEIKNYLRGNFSDVIFRKSNFNKKNEKYRDKINEVTEVADIKQGKLCMGFKTGITFKDKEIIPLLIFSEILGGSADSRLFASVREKEGLCYYINSFVYKFKGVVMVQAGIDIESYDKTVETIETTIKDMINNITDDEIKSAKKSVIKYFIDKKDSIPLICDSILDNIIIDENYSIDDYVKMIDNCTKNEITKVGKKIKPDTVYFISGRE